MAEHSPVTNLVSAPESDSEKSGRHQIPAPKKISQLPGEVILKILAFNLDEFVLSTLSTCARKKLLERRKNLHHHYLETALVSKSTCRMAINHAKKLLDHCVTKGYDCQQIYDELIEDCEEYENPCVHCKRSLFDAQELTARLEKLVVYC